MDTYRRPDRSAENPLVYDYSLAIERDRRRARIWSWIMALLAIAYGLLYFVPR